MGKPYETLEFILDYLSGADDIAFIEDRLCKYSHRRKPWGNHYCVLTGETKKKILKTLKQPDIIAKACRHSELAVKC